MKKVIKIQAIRRALRGGDSHTAEALLTQALHDLEDLTKLVPLFCQLNHPFAIEQLIARLKETLAPGLKLYEALGTLTLWQTRFWQEETFADEADRLFQLAEKKLGRIKNPERIATFYTQWATIWAVRGELSGEPGDLRRAELLARRALEASDADPSTWSILGQALYGLAKAQKQLPLFTQATHVLEKGGEDRFRLLALVAKDRYLLTWRLEDFQGAIEAFCFAEEKRVDDPQFWRAWGELNLRFGEFACRCGVLPSAIERLERSLAVNPEDLEAENLWIEAQLLLAQHKDDFSRLHLVNQRLKGAPERPQLLGKLAFAYGAYFREEQEWKRAISHFRQALAENSRDAQSIYGLALSYLAVGDVSGELEPIEHAAYFFDKAAKLLSLPSPVFWNDWGVCLMKLAEFRQSRGLVEGAIQRFERGIKLAYATSGPKSIEPEWLFNYGCAWDFLGEIQPNPECYQRAIEVLEKVIDLDPSFTPAQCHLAITLSHLGEVTGDVEVLDLASHHFADYLAAVDEDEEAWNCWGMTLINLAQASYDSLFPDSADSIYKQAETSFAHASRLGCQGAVYNMACLYALQGNHSQAMNFIEQAWEKGGLPSLDMMQKDIWLSDLRQTPDFQAFLEKIAPS